MQYIFRYVHPSGTVRFRVLIQKRNMRYQRYFETLEDAVEYRDALVANGITTQHGYSIKRPIYVAAPSFAVSFN